MMLYHPLIWSILLIQFFHGVKSKTFNQDFRSFTYHSKVKRAWVYPPMSVRENNQLITSAFVRKNIVTLSSTNPAVYDYQLLPGTIGVDEGYFTLESGGEVGDRDADLFQERKLDRETYPNFTIFARAFDAQGNIAEPNDVPLDILVLDVNDEIPVFITSTLVGGIPENGNVGSSFFTIRATDADSKADLNGVVRYSTVADSEQPPSPDGQARFSVNNLGQVSLLSSVDREAVSQITFLALAKDGHEEASGFTTTGTVTVNIVDANDNAPMFTMDPYPTISISELSPVNDMIMAVEASDEDIGSNKAVHFDITLGDSNGHFQIVSELNKDGLYVGTLTIQSPLDFETQSSYQLTILAKNKDANENAETLTSTTAVTIEVIDENEPPVFIGEPYSATVAENDPVRIDNLVKANAEDYDFNRNQTISYEFLNFEPWFDISSDGTISTVANNPVDREHINVNKVTNEYSLLVAAIDDYFPLKATATTSVIITIIDKNDNAPEKDLGWNTILCETPSEEMKRNISLISVKDKDSSIFTPFDFKILDSNSSFSLRYESENSRHVQTLKSNFDRSDVDVYEIPIQVTDTASGDQPAQTSTLTLTIDICSCDENDIPDCSSDRSLSNSVGRLALTRILPAVAGLFFLIFAVWDYKRRSNLKKKNPVLTDDKSKGKTYSQDYNYDDENDYKNYGEQSYAQAAV